MSRINVQILEHVAQFYEMKQFRLKCNQLCLIKEFCPAPVLLGASTKNIFNFYRNSDCIGIGENVFVNGKSSEYLAIPNKLFYYIFLCELSEEGNSGDESFCLSNQRNFELTTPRCINRRYLNRQWNASGLEPTNFLSDIESRFCINKFFANRRTFYQRLLDMKKVKENFTVQYLSSNI